MRLIYFPNANFSSPERTLLCSLDFDFAIYPVTITEPLVPPPDSTRLPANQDNNFGLFMAGCNTGINQKFAGIDLFLQVNNYYYSNNTIDLALSGNITPSGSTFLNLYISSENPYAVNSVPLYLEVGGGSNNNNLPLYIRGKFTDSSIPFNNGLGATGILNLYMMGEQGNFTIPTGDVSTNGLGSGVLDLYINAQNYSSSGSISCYLYGDSYISRNLNMFINGVTHAQNTGNISLFTSGLGYISSVSGKTLFIRGY